eukprot:365626-Chlamydomonas_euryale.AAC.2
MHGRMSVMGAWSDARTCAAAGALPPHPADHRSRGMRGSCTAVARQLQQTSGPGLLLHDKGGFDAGGQDGGAVVLLGCCKGVAGVLQRCCRGVARGCYNGVAGVLEGCCRGLAGGVAHAPGPLPDGHAHAGCPTPAPNSSDMHV